MSDGWMVVILQRGHELDACSRIEAQEGFRALVPLYLKRVKKGRRWEIVPRPLFGVYGFAHADGDWAPIAHTQFVTRVLTWPDGTPQYVPPEFMAELLAAVGEPLALMDDEAPRRKRFKRGQALRITVGAHTGIKGIYARHERDRVVALFEYLGTEREIELPEDMVELDKGRS